jgi:hypothetical protein
MHYTLYKINICLSFIWSIHMSDFVIEFVMIINEWKNINEE